LGNATTPKTQWSFVGATLLQTCYGFTAAKLGRNWCNVFEENLLREVANLLQTCYGEAGVIDFGV